MGKYILRARKIGKLREESITTIIEVYKKVSQRKFPGINSEKLYKTFLFPNEMCVYDYLKEFLGLVASGSKNKLNFKNTLDHQSYSTEVDEVIFSFIKNIGMDKDFENYLNKKYEKFEGMVSVI